MNVISGKIIQLSKKELSGMLDVPVDILSCQIKGKLSKDAKQWMDSEIKTCEEEKDLMRLDELKRGMINRPDLETVRALLKGKSLFQIQLVLHDKDFGILESGNAGEVTYIVDYGKK